jgi:ABC-type lipoprotein export system ATPase subunit
MTAHSSSTSNSLIRVEGVTRTYHVDGREVPALRGIDLTVARGELISLRGRSGSGKTTLLNCIGGLDRPTSGKVWIEDREVTRLSESDTVQLRRKRIGFVFQSFALLPIYSAAENIDLMLRLAGVNDRGERKRRVEYVLTLVGLKKWATHRPFELSGGQQQRVAIARALVTQPALILADEPTGELDSATGQQIMELFREIVDRERTTVLIATHNLAVDMFADRVCLLEDGQIREEIRHDAAAGAAAPTPAQR